MDSSRSATRPTFPGKVGLTPLSQKTGQTRPGGGVKGALTVVNGGENGPSCAVLWWPEGRFYVLDESKNWVRDGM